MGATVTVAYQNDGGAAAVQDSYTDFAIAYSPEMVEGLTLGYASADQETGINTSNNKTTGYAKYAVGGLTIGYQVSEADHDTKSSSADSSGYGVSYAVNDDFSIGYHSHTYEPDTAASGSGKGTLDQESTGVSASYTMGGMTVGAVANKTDSFGGTAGTDQEFTEVSLSFAF